MLNVFRVKCYCWLSKSKLNFVDCYYICCCLSYLASVHLTSFTRRHVFPLAAKLALPFMEVQVLVVMLVWASSMKVVSLPSLSSSVHLVVTYEGAESVCSLTHGDSKAHWQGRNLFVIFTLYCTVYISQQILAADIVLCQSCHWPVVVLKNFSPLFVESGHS